MDWRDAASFGSIFRSYFAPGEDNNLQTFECRRREIECRQS
jgi:hypothetical protein